MEAPSVENQGNLQAVAQNGIFYIGKAGCGDVGDPACGKNIAMCQSRDGFCL